MLNKDAKKRISVEQALKHPFFLKYSEYIEKIKQDYTPEVD